MSAKFFIHNGYTNGGLSNTLKMRRILNGIRGGHVLRILGQQIRLVPARPYLCEVSVINEYREELSKLEREGSIYFTTSGQSNVTLQQILENNLPKEVLPKAPEVLLDSAKKDQPSHTLPLSNTIVEPVPEHFDMPVQPPEAALTKDAEKLAVEVAPKGVFFEEKKPKNKK